MIEWPRGAKWPRGVLRLPQLFRRILQSGRAGSWRLGSSPCSCGSSHRPLQFPLGRLGSRLWPRRACRDLASAASILVSVSFFSNACFLPVTVARSRGALERLRVRHERGGDGRGGRELRLSGGPRHGGQGQARVHGDSEGRGTCGAWTVPSACPQRQ